MSFVLIVEDDDNIREMLKIVLEGEGYRVKGANGHAEAEGYLLRARPSLIIMDYWLGVDLGDGLIKMAKEEFSDPVPIVLCSAWKDIDKIGNANGIEHILTKPFGTDEILEKVMSALPITSFFSCNNNPEKAFNSFRSIRNRQSP